MPQLWLAVFLLLLLPMPSATAETTDDSVALIAHPNVRAVSLHPNSARAIFAMRQRTWPDGQAANVFVLPDDDPLHARFSKELLNVFPHQLKMAWDRAVFSGTGQAPGRVSTQSEMLERVATTPGAIGYVEKGGADARVRIIELQ